MYTLNADFGCCHHICIGREEGRFTLINEPAVPRALHRCYSHHFLRLQESQRMDFASAVERVLAATDDGQESTHSLSVMDVDHMLDRLAATCPFSAPKLQTIVGEVHGDPNDELISIFRRLHSVEASEAPKKLKPCNTTRTFGKWPQLHKVCVREGIVPDVITGRISKDEEYCSSACCEVATTGSPGGNTLLHGHRPADVDNEQTDRVCEVHMSAFEARNK